MQCHDVARGLRHLHNFSPPIIHGDMKPASICYVKTSGLLSLMLLNLIIKAQCCGSRRRTCSPMRFWAVIPQGQHHTSRIAQNTNALNNTIPQNTGFTATTFNGTLRYLAPEQLSCNNAKPTLAADIYAFACTCAEVCHMVNALPCLSPS